MVICFLQYERDQHCRSSSSPNYSEKTTREGGGRRRRRALNTSMCTSKNCGPALLHYTIIITIIIMFGENAMRMYMGGRQISNRQEQVHKRGGSKIK